MAAQLEHKNPGARPARPSANIMHLMVIATVLTGVHSGSTSYPGTAAPGGGSSGGGGGLVGQSKSQLESPATRAQPTAKVETADSNEPTHELEYETIDRVGPAKFGGYAREPKSAASMTYSHDEEGGHDSALGQQQQQHFLASANQDSEPAQVKLASDGFVEIARLAPPASTSLIMSGSKMAAEDANQQSGTQADSLLAKYNEEAVAAKQSKSADYNMAAGGAPDTRGSAGLNSIEPHKPIAATGLQVDNQNFQRRFGLFKKGHSGNHNYNPNAAFADYAPAALSGTGAAGAGGGDCERCFLNSAGYGLASQPAPEPSPWMFEPQLLQQSPLRQSFLAGHNGQFFHHHLHSGSFKSKFGKFNQLSKPAMADYYQPWATTANQAPAGHANLRYARHPLINHMPYRVAQVVSPMQLNCAHPGQMSTSNAPFVSSASTNQNVVVEEPKPIRQLPYPGAQY